MAKNKSFAQRYLGWGITLIVLVIALTFGLRPQPMMVEAAEVAQSEFKVTIDEEGVTRVKDRFVISAPVSGYVRRIALDIGDTVEKQKELTLLEPLRSDVLDPRNRAEAEARVAAANAALLVAQQQSEAAKVEADFANQEFDRKQALKKKGFIADEELQLAQTEKRRANAVLRSSQFSVDVARYDLQAANTLLQYSAAQPTEGVLREHVPIQSPVAGSVLSIHRKSEGVVSAGTPLLELGDPAALEVAVDVLSFDAVNIKPGMPVELKRWGGDIIDGIVRVVEPVGFTKVSALGVEEQRVWVIIDLVSPRSSWERLGDGYRMEATFLVWQQADIIQTPNASLFRLDNQWRVFVIEDDVISLRTVEVGRRNGLNAEIKSGLSVGEIVVIHPDSDLTEGARVSVRP
ncbi:MAG: HlyD family efflux transporter periplasmic adaptor subunit [Pseudomonadales bacterium]|nr:HlyD family efflux transporter periplasmic adaptor subunit [Pseudomonadales bacterium]